MDVSLEEAFRRFPWSSSQSVVMLPLESVEWADSFCGCSSWRCSWSFNLYLKSAREGGYGVGGADIMRVHSVPGGTVSLNHK